jgi:hypothetical protein
MILEHLISLRVETVQVRSDYECVNISLQCESFVLPLKGSTPNSVYEIMAIYDLAYAEEHLGELFHEARLGEQVIIVRADGKACELTPIAEVEQDEPLAEHVPIPPDTVGTGDLVPV